MASLSPPASCAVDCHHAGSVLAPNSFRLFDALASTWLLYLTKTQARCTLTGLLDCLVSIHQMNKLIGRKLLEAVQPTTRTATGPRFPHLCNKGDMRTCLRGLLRVLRSSQQKLAPVTLTATMQSLPPCHLPGQTGCLRYLYAQSLMMCTSCHRQTQND